MPAVRFDFIKNNEAVAVVNDGNGNVAVEEGSTFTFDLFVTDATDVAVDLTGYDARMKIRKHVNDTTVLASWSVSGGEITLNGTSDPNLSISVTATATAALEWDGSAFYDLEIDDQGGTPVVTRLIEGYIELSREVTR